LLTLRRLNDRSPISCINITPDITKGAARFDVLEIGDLHGGFATDGTSFCVSLLDIIIILSIGMQVLRLSEIQVLFTIKILGLLPAHIK
jgi:hypothetical protein